MDPGRPQAHLAKGITMPPKSLRSLQIVAFGTEKTLDEWLDDPRSQVGDLLLLQQRLRRGWLVEKALCTPPQTTAIRYHAWGEQKTLRQWQKDPRCQASQRMIYKRIHYLGWSTEKAIATPTRQPKTSMRNPVEMFGITRELEWWLAQPVCTIDRKTLFWRLRHGWPLERAYLTPPLPAGLFEDTRAQETSIHRKQKRKRRKQKKT